MPVAMDRQSQFEKELAECKDYVDVRCTRPHIKFKDKVCNKLLGKIKTSTGTQMILYCPSCKKNTRVTFH